MADPDDDDEGPELPLEGATCTVHGDRPAFRVCPLCNHNACLGCWHPSIGRCHACLVKDARTFPALPWEDRSRTIFGRYFFTLTSALSPDSSGPGFARESDTTGAVFALLTLVPFGLLAGIIPYTRTLLFASSFEVRVIGGADTEAIAIDVLVAAFTGLLVSVVWWLAVALPYVSLSRAYADRGMPTAPIRVMNYRGWLIPLSLALWHGIPFCLPEPTSPPALLLMRLLACVPVLLLFVAMRAGARMGSGAGPIATLAILVVPLALFLMSVRFVEPLEVVPSPEDVPHPPASAAPPTTTP